MPIARSVADVAASRVRLGNLPIAPAIGVRARWRASLKRRRCPDAVNVRLQPNREPGQVNPQGDKQAGRNVGHVQNAHLQVEQQAVKVGEQLLKLGRCHVMVSCSPVPGAGRSD